MSDDFGFSKETARRVLSSARTRAVITEAREQGKSPYDTASCVMSDMTDQEWSDLGSMVKFCSVVSDLHRITQPDSDSLPQCLNGYAYIVQGYVEHPEALKFDKRFISLVTVGDAIQWYLDGEDMSLGDLKEKFPSTDWNWFNENFQSRPLQQYTGFGLNEEHQRQIDLEHHTAAEESRRKIEKANKIHQQLMCDEPLETTNLDPTL